MILAPLVLTFLLAAPIQSQAQTQAVPPGATPTPTEPPTKARTVEVTGNFGTRLADPYRWMESGGDELAQRLASQRAYTERQLTLQGREHLAARVRDVSLGAGRVTIDRMAGPYRFSSKLCELNASKTPWRKMAEYSDGIQNVAIFGDDLILLTHVRAPNGRLLAVPLEKPEPARPRVLTPEAPDASVQDFTITRDAICLVDQLVGRARLRRLSGGAPWRRRGRRRPGSSSKARGR